MRMDEQCKPEGEVALHKTMSVCSRPATDFGKEPVMRRVALLFVGLLLVAMGALLAPTLGVRAASTTRFEYLHLTPGLPEFDVKTGQRVVNTHPQRSGYSACIASRPAQEKCREFEDPEHQSRALDVALATLGSEGWEMVAVVDQTQSQGTPRGLIYVFKHQLQQ
jgi:hypothetical protein